MICNNNISSKIRTAFRSKFIQCNHIKVSIKLDTIVSDIEWMNDCISESIKKHMWKKLK